MKVKANKNFTVSDKDGIETIPAQTIVVKEGDLHLYNEEGEAIAIYAKGNWESVTDGSVQE